jgi:hypothetical protein
VSNAAFHAPARTAALWLLAVWCCAYLPDVGHGFVKDDFAWIAHSRLVDLSSFEHITFDALGFYRPIVAASFMLNDLIFGAWSFGFGLTNCLLALACAAAIAALARDVGLGPRTAVAAAALWAFNFHGINMAVLWLSGRTSLLLTLFGVMAIRSAIRRRRLALFAWTLLALGSKEEAVLLPLVCLVWALPGAWWRSSHRWRGMVDAARDTAGAWFALAPYAWLRLQSGAMTPAAAPDHYRFTVDPGTVARNIAAYADRSSTFAVAALVLLAVMMRRRPSPGSIRGDTVAKGLALLVAGFGITVWLPVRSSLYSVWPSVGIVIAVAAIAEAWLVRASAREMRRLAWTAALLPVLLLPIYWQRNTRWVELADLSTRTLGVLQQHTPAIAEGSVIELVDDGTTRANLTNAFGELVTDAADLYLEGKYELRIEKTGQGTPGSPASIGADAPRAVFRLVDGELERVD